MAVNTTILHYLFNIDSALSLYNYAFGNVFTSEISALAHKDEILNKFKGIEEKICREKQ